MILIPCSCGKSLAAKPEWAGIVIRCAGCGRGHDVAEASARPRPMEAVGASVSPPEKPCLLCGESIKAAAIKCRHCGEFLDRLPAAGVDDGGVGILILGIVSWMFLFTLASPIAWALGASYEASCRARGVAPSGAGRAGKVLGIVGTVVLLLAAGFVALVLLAAGAPDVP